MDKGGEMKLELLPVEKEVVQRVKDRLELGRGKYGGDIPINGEKNRDNLKESIEEVLDLAVYAAALLIEEERHLNKYKEAYHIFMERWDSLPPSDQFDIGEELEELGL
jgi:hypothetical protein|tara:strand:+ start:2144 stop:2467 length:324 start_codon:yes stop_codon:yes gene_type:complete